MPTPRAAESTGAAAPAPEAGAPLPPNPAINLVVVVDDQPMIGEAVRRMVVAMGDFDFHYVANPLQAIDTLLGLAPSVLLLDLVMPEIDGIQLLGMIRAHPRLVRLPVVLLSTTDDAATKARAFEAGADDYLVKLPEKTELQARLRYHARSYQTLVQRDEAFEALRESQRKLQQMTLELLQLSQVDGLTGLINRRHFDELLAQELRRSARGAQPLALLMIDIDHFKRYNDHFGHVQGDHCLKAVARAVQLTARRAGDHVARYGGEEFAVIAPNCDVPQAAELARRVGAAVDALRVPHPESVQPWVSLSIGYAVALPDESPDSLIRRADAALYQAKAAGRHRAQEARVGAPPLATDP